MLLIIPFFPPDTKKSIVAERKALDTNCRDNNDEFKVQNTNTKQKNTKQTHTNTNSRDNNNEFKVQPSPN